jgi:opacity protein-like surface antigen
MNLTRNSLTRFLRINQAIHLLMKRCAYLSVFALFFCFSPASRAQDFQAGINFTTAFPTGDFKKNIDSNGYGAGGEFLYGIRKSPFLIGADLNFVTYGSESFRESLSPRIPEIRVRVNTSNNIFMSHFVLRAQKREGKVRPYVDGLVGLKHLFTRTSVSNDFTGEEFAGDTNLSDTTFSYGIGGGAQFLLTTPKSGPEILLDTKVRYLKGSDAEYLKKGSIFRDNGDVFFDTLHSRTDLVTLQIGVTFRF